MIAIDIPNYKYATVTDSKRISLDHPQGNAFYGVPYGQKNGPALAVIGPALSIKAGFAAMGTLAGGLMIASGALGMVGALTGNKTLSALGMIGGIAGGFIGTDGGFMNPFTDGFEASALGEGTGSIFDSIKESLGLGSSTTSALPDFVPANLGEEILTSAGGNGALADAIGSAGVIDEAGGMGGSGSSSGGGGLLGKLGGMKDVMGMVSGAADAYMTQPVLNARVDNLDANTDKTRQEIGLAQQRQNNMQFQDTGNLAQINNNADVYNTTAQTTAPAGRYAVVVGNQVKYVTGEEYQALQAAKAQQQAQPPGGLINQGAVA